MILRLPAPTIMAPIVGELVQTIDGPTTRLWYVAEVDLCDVGDGQPDRLHLVSCSTGSEQWLDCDRVIRTGREASEDDFSTTALAAIRRRRENEGSDHG